MAEYNSVSPAITVPANGTRNYRITFPQGWFNKAPCVHVSVEGSTTVTASFGAPTQTEVTATVRNTEGAPQTVRVHYRATDIHLGRP